MLDNILFFFRETMLPVFLGLLLLQIVVLIVACRKNNVILWCALYVLIGLSMLGALVSAAYWNTTGISHLADTFISVGAFFAYLMIWIWASIP